VRRVAELGRLAADAGRPPIPVTLSGARPDPDLIERGERIGVHRCTIYITPADAGETERQLDELVAIPGFGYRAKPPRCARSARRFDL